MKKLKGITKNFSSLENKKLKDTKAIVGGMVAPTTNDVWWTDTCLSNGNADTQTWKDGYAC